MHRAPTGAVTAFDRSISAEVWASFFDFAPVPFALRVTFAGVKDLIRSEEKMGTGDWAWREAAARRDVLAREMTISLEFLRY